MMHTPNKTLDTTEQFKVQAQQSSAPFYLRHLRTAVDWSRDCESIIAVVVHYYCKINNFVQVHMQYAVVIASFSISRFKA